MVTAGDDSPDGWRLRAGAVLAGCLMPLNSTMIVVALSDIGRRLSVPRATVALLVTSYLVAMLLLQPVAGRIGDRVGPRRLTMWALAGFGATSALTSLAPSFGWLLAGRCTQAVFGAALIPNVQALLRAAVPAESRGRAFGQFAAGVGAGAAIGPVLGGALVSLGGWPALFRVSVPLCLAAMAGLGGSHDVRSAGSTRSRERWTELRRPAFVAACVAQATSNYCTYLILLVVPLALAGRHWPAPAVGAAVFGLTAGMVVMPPIGGRLADRVARSLPVVAGFAAATAGVVVIAADPGRPPAVIAGMVVVGCGTGLATGSLQAAALEAVGSGSAATAGGVFSTSRYVGSIIASLAVAATTVGDGTGARPVLAAAALAMAVAAAAGGRVEERAPAAGAGVLPLS